MEPRLSTKKIILHCSDTEGGDASAIRRYHMETNHWEDIGYHYVITLKGEIQAGRAENLIGSHCVDENHDSIGICLIGKDYNEFTQAQFDSLKTSVRVLLKKYGLSWIDIFGHYEMPSGKAEGKTCPNLNANLLRALFKGDQNEIVNQPRPGFFGFFRH